MESASINVHFGCNDHDMVIAMKATNKQFESWDETWFLKYHRLDPRNIATMELGPRTVVELFSEPAFFGESRLIENVSTAESRFIDIGCNVDHHWKGYVRSMKIWNYDYYYHEFKRIRYCTKNIQCGSQEYCLCPGGQFDQTWCATEKKRCLPISKFLHAKPKRVLPNDTVDINCMINELSAMDPHVHFRNVMRAGDKCYYKYLG